MANQEVGDINKTKRGVLFEEQPDGTFARVHSIMLRAFNPIGAHTQNSSLSTVQTLTPPASANKLLVQAFVQNVRYTLDGTDPTASLGFQLKADDPPIVIPIGIGTTVKAIEEAATATLDFQWGN